MDSRFARLIHARLVHGLNRILERVRRYVDLALKWPVDGGNRYQHQRDEEADLEHLYDVQLEVIDPEKASRSHRHDTADDQDCPENGREFLSALQQTDPAMFGHRRQLREGVIHYLL